MAGKGGRLLVVRRRGGSPLMVAGLLLGWLFGGGFMRNCGIIARIQFGSPKIISQALLLYNMHGGIWS